VTALLELANVDAFYGNSHVLHGLSMTVNAGEAILLLGRNGAGKTTVMNTVMGLASVHSGKVSFDTHDVTGLEPHEIAQLGVGLVPENRRMFASLTVAENLELGRKPGRGVTGTAWDIDQVLNLFPALRELRHRNAGNLSGGQQQMVAIARTLLGNPTLLLLDEPAEGLAPIIVQELARQLVAIRQRGLSMVISEQNLSFARALADRVYILETGSIRYSGTPAELAANPEQWTRFVSF
jgi:branched-chain amino acid transport system ATP-binding protein